MTSKKHPNLVESWTPFKPVPKPVPTSSTLSSSTKVSKSTIRPVESIVQFDYVHIPLTRNDVIRRNSAIINILAFLFMLGSCYFLYSIYQERKLAAQYLEYVKNTQNRRQSGELGHHGLFGDSF